MHFPSFKPVFAFIVYVSHVKCQIFVEKIISQYLNIKIYFFLSSENVFNCEMTYPEHGGISNFWSHENAFSFFLNNIDTSLLLVCIVSSIARKPIQRWQEAGQNLSLITADITIFSAPYQLWKSQTGQKI